MRHLHPMKTYKYKKMNISLRKSLFAIALFSFVGAFAQGPNNSGTYYSAADGKKGKALKTALSKIIGNPDVVSYKSLPEAYKKTDRRDDGKVWDMYSLAQLTTTSTTTPVATKVRATCTIVSTLSRRVGSAARYRLCIATSFT